MPDFHFRLPLLTIVFRVLKISVLFYSIFLILPIAISFSRTRKLLFSVTLTSFTPHVHFCVPAFHFSSVQPVQILSASAAPPAQILRYVYLDRHILVTRPEAAPASFTPLPRRRILVPNCVPGTILQRTSPCMVRTRTSPPKTAVVNGMRAVV